MTSFCPLLGWYSMCIEPLNGTSVIVVRYLQAILCMWLVRIIEKVIRIRSNYTYFVFVVLGFIMERFALAIVGLICLGFWGDTNWPVTEWNLWFFGTKDHRILSTALNNPNRTLVVAQKICLDRKLSVPQINLKA